MSVTTEGFRRHAPIPTRHGRQRTAALIVVLLLAGCAEEPLPQRPISREDCLRTVKLEELPAALERCDKVVAAFPKDPGPLNERFLLHTLAGDTAAACRDIATATALAAKVPRGGLDPILRQDLEVRLKSCRGEEPRPTPSPGAHERSSH
ncbi:MAG: hypothetical protein ER33_05830 [Cyanobium sp. CACIAM 14]|nr:MAG: hypothetical protein ER33_05830 [Cyanobium sp. CACIAM 14]